MNTVVGATEEKRRNPGRGVGCGQGSAPWATPQLLHGAPQSFSILSLVCPGRPQKLAHLS